MLTDWLLSLVSARLHLLIYKNGRRGQRILIVSQILLVLLAFNSLFWEIFFLLLTYEVMLLFVGENCNGWEVCWSDRFISVCCEGLMTL